MATAYVTATSGASADSLADTSITTTVASSTINDTNFCWINLTNGTGTAPTVTPPAGWTTIGTTTDGASPTLWAGLFCRVFQSGDTTTPSWGFSNGCNAVWNMVAYSGLDPTTPYSNASIGPYTGSTATKVSDVVTTSSAGWIVTGFGDRAKGIYSSLTDTSRCTSRLTVYANACSQVIQDSNGDVAAGSQSRTVQGPSGTSVGSSFIIRLAPGVLSSPSAQVASGTGVGYDATVSTSGGGSNAPAAAPLGTGNAYDAHPLHSPLKEWMQDKGKMYVAHRGGSADFVEMSADAYARCDAMAIQAIEISVWKTSDNVWVCSHDQTTTRMFGVNIDIPTNTWASLSGLTTTVGGFPMARMVDMLNLYANNNHIIFIDNKQSANVSAFLDILDGYANSTGIFVIKSFYSGSATGVAGRLRGYTTWGYYYNTDLGSLDATFDKYDILGLNYDASAPDWVTIKAKGKPVLAHVALTSGQAATGLATGADGIVTGKILGVVPNAPATLASGVGTAYDASTTLLGPGQIAAFQATADGVAFNATTTQTAVSAFADSPLAAGVASDATIEVHERPVYVYFTTPTRKQRWMSKDRVKAWPLWQRMYIDVGQSLLKFGSSYQLIIEPSDEQVAAATAAYIGGRTYAVTVTEGDALANAGYGHWITDTLGEPLPEIDYSLYGVGPYGSGPYGD